jgi:steroid delta-isomerase-like uncharacterized protein
MRPGVFFATTSLIAIVAACYPSPNAQLEANKELVRQFTEATNAADWEALAAVVSEDFTRHSAATAGPPVTSREAFVELQKSFLVSLPDQHVTIQQLVAEGDLVAGLSIYSGTHTGPMGDIPPTGLPVEIPFMGLFRIESGQITELWVEWDNVAMLAQLGLFPPPPPESPN